MQYPPKDPIHARFTYQDDGTVQQLGMISHKKSLITIFGHKDKIKNFIRGLPQTKYVSRRRGRGVRQMLMLADEWEGVIGLLT